MLFLKKNYPEIVEDVLTELTGGVVDEEYLYSAAEQEYLLKYTPVKNVVSIAGQVNDEIYLFKDGVDWRLVSDRIVWQKNGTKPDIGTTFFVSYYHEKSRSRITDKNIGSVNRTIVEALSREFALIYAQLMKVYDTAFIDTASGISLDNVVALLGISRKKLQASKGYVVFGRKNPPKEEIIIPKGTKVATGTEPKIEFITTEEGRLDDSCLNPKFSAALVEIEDKINAKKVELNGYEKQKIEEEEKLNTIDIDLKEIDKRLITINESLKEVNRTINDKTNELNEAKGQLSILLSQKQSDITHLEILNSQLARISESEKENLKKEKIAPVEKQIEDINKQIDTQKEKIEGLNKQIDTQKKKISEIEKNINIAESATKTKEIEKTNQEKVIIEVTNTIEKCNEEIRALLNSKEEIKKGITVEISVPIEAVNPGEGGNVEAGSITIMPHPPTGIEYVINPCRIAKKIEFKFKLGQEEYEIDDTVYSVIEVKSDSYSFKPLRDYNSKENLIIWHSVPDSGTKFKVIYDDSSHTETFTFEIGNLKYELSHPVNSISEVKGTKYGIEYTFIKEKDYYLEDNSIIWTKRPGINNKFTVWYEVLNPITGGSKDESDDLLRDRAKHRLDIVGKATTESLKYAVLEVEGVKSAKVLEKNRGEVEVIVNTIEETMSPAVRRAVKDVIDDTRAAGIFVTFNPPAAKPIDINLNLQYQDEISAMRKKEIEELLERSIKEYITNLDIGEDLLQTELIRICLRFDEVKNCKILSPPKDVAIKDNEVAMLNKVTFEEWS